MKFLLFLRNSIPPELLDAINSVNVNLNQTVSELSTIRPKIDTVLEKFSNGSYDSAKKSAIIETSHILSTIRHEMTGVNSNLFIIQSTLEDYGSKTENLDKKIVAKILADKLSSITLTANLIDSSSKLIIEKIVSISDTTLTNFHQGLKDLTTILERFDENIQFLLKDLQVLLYDDILVLEENIQNSREILVNALYKSKNDIIQNLTYSLDFKFDNLELPECENLAQTLAPNTDEIVENILSNLDFSECQKDFSCVCPEPVLECSCPKYNLSCPSISCPKTPDIHCDCPSINDFVDCQREIQLECPSHECNCLTKQDFVNSQKETSFECPSYECNCLSRQDFESIFKYPDVNIDFLSKQDLIDFQENLNVCLQNQNICPSAKDFLECQSTVNLECPEVNCSTLISSSEGLDISSLVDVIVEKLSVHLKSEENLNFDEDAFGEILRNLTNSKTSSLETYFEELALMKLENFLLFCNLGLMMIMMILLITMMILYCKTKKVLKGIPGVPTYFCKGYSRGEALIFEKMILELHTISLKSKILHIC